MLQRCSGLAHCDCSLGLSLAYSAMKAVQRAICSVIRTAGQSLDALGRGLEVTPYVEKLQPSLRSAAIKGVRPNIAGSFVAPSAAVVGNVTVGANSAVWYGAVVRGGKADVTIGDNSSIGDLSVISSVKQSTKIGSNVSIGSGAWVVDSVVENNSIIGEGAKIGTGAFIQANAVVAAGAVVPAGTTIPSGQLWAGAPAAFLRTLSEAELAALHASHSETLDLAVVHAGENAKSWERIEVDEYDYEQIENRHPDYFVPQTPEQMAKSLGDFEGHSIPGRILDHPVSAGSSTGK
eukprot:gene10797-11999_t